MALRQTHPSIAEELGSASGGLWVLTSLLLLATTLSLDGTLHTITLITLGVPWLIFGLSMVVRLVAAGHRADRGRIGLAFRRVRWREQPT